MVRTYATARWFRAVDIPLRKPAFYNFEPSGPATKFKPFAKLDSDQLEWARARGIPQMLVEKDGLQTVDLRTNVCKPTYYDGSEFLVRRHLWFERSGGKLTPVSPKVEAELERRFGTLPLYQVPLGTSFKIDNSVYTRTKLGAEVHRQWVGLKSELVRGAEHGTLEDVKKECLPYKQRPIKHLVFCIHGIGQLLSVAFEQINFVNDVNKLREIMLQSPLGNDVQVLPVMWRHKLDNRIMDINPQQLFGSRNLAADAALDFVLYMEPRNRRNILTAAAAEMRTMYAKFCANNPEFAENPKVSIIGHSLGSVLAYELVNPNRSKIRQRIFHRHHKLPFPVHSLFTLGSPLGVLELIHQRSISRGNAQSMYNIMRLADPVAARMEPLVIKEALKEMPQMLKSTGILQTVQDVQGGLMHTVDKVKNMFAAAAEVQVKPQLGAQVGSQLGSQLGTHKNENTPMGDGSGSIDLGALAQFNRHKRLDFAVPESVDLSLVLGVMGHLMYLDNPDVVRFVLEELHAN